MLSLLKKLFAKKEEKPVAPWPFPTGIVKNQKPTIEPAVAEPTIEPAVVAPVAKSKKSAKPQVVAKTPTRKPRAKKVQ